MRELIGDKVQLGVRVEGGGAKMREKQKTQNKEMTVTLGQLYVEQCIF